MQFNATTHPLILLSELDEACKSQIPTAPPRKNSTRWVGIGFKLDQYNLAIETTFINEVLDAKLLNNISKVPAAKSWFCGLISVRGQLLPVIDLKDYLLGEHTVPGKSSRLIVIKHGNINAGLLVEEVFGLKQFGEGHLDKHKDQSSVVPASLTRFITQLFNIDQNHWGGLSINALTNDTDFLNASMF